MTFCKTVARVPILGLTLVLGAGTPLGAAAEDRPATERGQDPRAQNDNSSSKSPIEQERAGETLEYLAAMAKNLQKPETKAICLAALGSTYAIKDRSRGLGLLKNAYLVVDGLLDRAPDGSADARVRTIVRERVNQLRTQILRQISMIDGTVGSELAARASRGSGSPTVKEDPAYSGRIAQYQQSQALMQAAYELLPTDPQRATSLVQQSLLFGVPGWLHDFLMQLRQREPALADQLYGMAFSVATRTNPPSLDALTVLTGYVFPGFFTEASTRRGVDAVRAQQFLSAMAGALGAAATGIPSESPHRYQILRHYAIIQRLLPLFQQYRPDLAPALRSLLQAASAASTSELRPKLELSQGTSATASNFAQELFAEAEKATSSDARDAILSQAALLIAHQGDFERAHQIILRIVSAKLREETLEKAAHAATLTALSQGDFDRATLYTREIKRVRGRVESLVLIGNRLVQAGDNDQAALVLNEAQSLIRPLEARLEKAQLSFILAGAYLRLDVEPGTELLQAGIQVVNRISEAFESAGRSAVELEQERHRVDSALRQSLDTAFGMLARASFDHAMSVSTGLNKLEYRIIAQAAACRSALGTSAASKPAVERRDAKAKARDRQ